MGAQAQVGKSGVHSNETRPVPPTPLLSGKMFPGKIKCLEQILVRTIGAPVHHWCTYARLVHLCSIGAPSAT